MVEGSDLSQHINVFNQVINDLNRVDVKLEDEDKALMLLNSLPTYTTYDNLVTTPTWGKESLELEDVIGVLLAFHQRTKVSDDSFQAEWLIVKGNQERGRSSNKGGWNGKNSRSKYRTRKDVSFYKCSKKWHIKWDCIDQKKNKDNENEGSSRSVNIVEDDSDAADGYMLFVVSNSEYPVNPWILDSTFSFHVTSNRDLFDTYMLVNSDILTMGSGAHWKITGICNIRVKMFDGMVRTLCDLKHAPDVEKNLISLVL